MSKYVLRVKELFMDKYDNSIKYEPGAELIIEDEERAKDIINRKLATLVDEIKDTPAVPVTDNADKDEPEDKKKTSKK